LPPPSPPPLPPPPPALVEVGLAVRFSELDMSSFDDPLFDFLFRAEVVDSVAAAAGVHPSRVLITDIVEGSVRVYCVVQFVEAAEANRDSFVATVTADSRAVFATSPTLQSYGSITSEVRRFHCPDRGGA
jgi:hypothetical protein